MNVGSSVGVRAALTVGCAGCRYAGGAAGLRAGCYSIWVEGNWRASKSKRSAPIAGSRRASQAHMMMA